MIYLYQPKGMTQTQWQCVSSAVQAIDDSLVLWNEDHLETTISDLLAVSKPLAKNALPVLAAEADAQTLPLFLLMDLPEEALDRFLMALREKACAITLKAIVTENNRQWTLNHLIQDVAEEAKIVRTMMQLKQLVQASEGFPADHYEPEQWADFVKVREETQAFLKEIGKRDVTAADMEWQKMRFHQAALTLMGKGESS